MTQPRPPYTEIKRQIKEILENHSELCSSGHLSEALDLLTALVQQLLIEARILQLNLLKGEYFGVIGEINSTPPLRPITSNSLVNRIDEMIADLERDK